MALLGVNNPIGVIFTGCFMSILNISGLQLTNLTAYNEYITDVIIATIVYLSAFFLLIRGLLSGRHKKTEKPAGGPAPTEEPKPVESANPGEGSEKGGGEA